MEEAQKPAVDDSELSHFDCALDPTCKEDHGDDE
jgi:hypothetical protein